MKLLYFLTVFFTANVFSYNLLYIGEVESEQWNDTFGKFINYPLKVYAGGTPDGSERIVQITIKNSFGDDFNKYLVSKKCTERQIKEKECNSIGYTYNYEYLFLVATLRKSIEWTRIKKENNIEKVHKSLAPQLNDKGFASPFGDGSPRFFAEGDYRADLIFPTKFNLIGEIDRYYSSEAQEVFLEHLLKVKETVDRSIEENKKIDDLFK